MRPNNGDQISKISLENNPIILIRTDPAVYLPLRWKLLNKFKTTELALISMNAPHYEIFNGLSEMGIDPQKFFIIDGQTQRTETCALNKALKLNSARHTTFPGAPGSLTGLSITMRRLLEKNKFGLVILDSLSTLMIYNEPKQTQKFVHSLIEKLRSAGVPGIFIALEGTQYSDDIRGMTQFFDSIIQTSPQISKGAPVKLEI
jgi:hypothetical protein